MSSVPTLIGMVDQPIAPSHTVGWDTNKIGGTPSWLTPPASQPLCAMCGRPTTLICQLYCPLNDSAYHRCLFVFACLSPCSKKSEGWTVLRQLKLDPTYKTVDVKTQDTTADSWGADSWLDDEDDWGQGSDDWGQGSDDWGESLDGKENIDVDDKQSDKSSLNESVASNTKDMDTEAFSQLSISENALQGNTTLKEQQSDVTEVGGKGTELLEEPLLMVQDQDRLNAVAALLNTKLPESQCDSSSMNARDEEGQILSPFYLYVIDEPTHSSGTTDADHVTKLLKNYEQTEGTSLEHILNVSSKQSGKGPGKETYEKAELKHGDKIFHKFLKRLQRCPQQCVRYSRGGSPLLVSHMDTAEAASMAKCGICGGGRMFELQLLPPLICSLKMADGSPSPIEFGTLLVYSCEKDCWPDNNVDVVVKEAAFLQSDPDEHLYTATSRW